MNLPQRTDDTDSRIKVLRDCGKEHITPVMTNIDSDDDDDDRRATGLPRRVRARHWFTARRCAAGVTGQGAEQPGDDDEDARHQRGSGRF